MDKLDSLKTKLITACHILDSEGVMDELGHFSARCPDPTQILINGKVSPGQAREKDLVVLDLEGRKLAGDVEVASESPLHLAVYQKRPDVMAIAHTHSPMVVTLSIAGKDLRTVENQGASIVGKGVPVFTGYGLINSFDLANAVADTMGDHNMCVLKSHGNIVVGDSIESACVMCLWAEKSARYQYQAMQLGEPDWYPEEEIDKMHQQQMAAKGHVRTWNYYAWKVRS